jgi:hypothetical protein
MRCRPLTATFTVCFVLVFAACDSTGTSPLAIPTIPDLPQGFLRFVAIDAATISVCGITVDSLTYC